MRVKEENKEVEEDEDVPEGYDRIVWNELPVEIRNELKRAQSSSKRQSGIGERKREGKGRIQQSSLKFGQIKKIELYRDESFPPDSSSIDGRKEATSSQSAGKCSCGKDRILRQVHKCGINQGRYFYSCLQRQCNSFSWADEAPHRQTIQNLVWKNFNINDGWKLVLSRGFSAGISIQYH